MQHYETIADLTRNGFDIIVDKTWEDLSLSQFFDESCHNIAELAQDIDSGNLDWFMLRVRVMFDGHEVAANYLGGCLYKDAQEVMTDGTAEDLIEHSLKEAQDELRRLKHKLIKMDLETA